MSEKVERINYILNIEAKNTELVAKALEVMAINIRNEIYTAQIGKKYSNVRYYGTKTKKSFDEVNLCLQMGT